MMKLYWSPRSRSFSALWLMEETGQPYERVLTDIYDRRAEDAGISRDQSDGQGAGAEGRRGDARAKPRRSAPTLPSAIPKRNWRRRLGDPRRAKYLQWLFFSPSCIEPALIQIFTKIEVPPSTAAWGSATQVFDVLDEALEKGPWLLGDTFSAADIMIGSGLNFAVRLFKMVPPRPSFDRYIDRCAARPAFQRAEKIAAG